MPVSSQPAGTPNAPSYSNEERLLGAQDILRRRSQKGYHHEHLIKIVLLILAFTAAFSQAIAAYLKGYFPALEKSHVMLIIGTCSVFLEFLARIISDRAYREHLLSRRALSLAMPCNALGRQPTLAEVNALPRQIADFPSPNQIEEHLTKEHDRFHPWWISKRLPGLDRLSALLYDNLQYTIYVLEKTRASARNGTLLISALFLLSLILGAVIANQSAPMVMADFLIPILLFLFATNLLNISESNRDYLDECRMINELLRGIDQQSPEEKQRLLLSLLARYSAVTSAYPPISTTIYESVFRSSSAAFMPPTHESIEGWLKP